MSNGKRTNKPSRRASNRFKAKSHHYNEVNFKNDSISKIKPNYKRMDKMLLYAPPSSKDSSDYRKGHQAGLAKRGDYFPNSVKEIKEVHRRIKTPGHTLLYGKDNSRSARFYSVGYREGYQTRTLMDKHRKNKKKK